MALAVGTGGGEARQASILLRHNKWPDWRPWISASWMATIWTLEVPSSSRRSLGGVQVSIAPFLLELPFMSHWCASASFVHLYRWIKRMEGGRDELWLSLKWKRANKLGRWTRLPPSLAYGALRQTECKWWTMGLTSWRLGKSCIRCVRFYLAYISHTAMVQAYCSNGANFSKANNPRMLGEILAGWPARAMG